MVFFAPALFSGIVLAPGDGRLFYYPHYHSSLKLWDPLLMTGYPAVADPQLMSWYPLALLLRLVPGSWNVFVLSAYILASWLMYLFVRQVTARNLAGLVSGLIFGLCGFMNAHLGHVTMIQTAAWIPATLLCLERLATELRWRWVVLGSLSTGLCVLAGHPQIALYGLTLMFFYAVVRGTSAAPGKWRYYASSALMIAAGLALSTVAILPAAETTSLSTRASLSFAEFSRHALRPRELATLLFPFVFGGVGPAHLSHIPYFGSETYAENTGYVGLAALVLAGIAVVSRRLATVFFWLACMAISLIAAMGAATPFGRLLYALPAFGQFRAQDRFLLIFGIAAAVLAGYGVAAILERKNPVSNTLLALCAVLGLFFYAARIALVNAIPLAKAATAAGALDFSASPFVNPWIGATLWIGCLMCGMLVLLIRKPGSRLVRACFVLTVIAELAHCSWFGEWRFESSPAQVFAEPEIVRREGPVVRRLNARWVPVRGYLARPAEAPADLSLLWQLASLAKYGPLMSARYRELLNMEVNGLFLGQWWEPENRALDITGGRFIAVPQIRKTDEEIFGDIRFSSQDLHLAVGNDCGADVPATTISVQPPQAVRGIALVSETGCSEAIEQGTPVAEIHFREPEGTVISLPIRAGVETSEWAASCGDVAPGMRHRAAAVYSRHAVPRGEGACQAQTYSSILNLPKPAAISAMEIRWLPASAGVLRINKLSLLSDQPGRSQPLSEQDARFGDPLRWKRLDQAGGVEVFENLRAQPRVWLVGEIVTAEPRQIVRAIRASHLPDGRAYDPSAVAMVEEPLTFRASAPDPDARAWILEDKGSSVEIRTSSRQPAFLVLADLDYPGWKATVNGRPAHIYRTNYIQRGMLLPPGANSVRFEFCPMRFYAGAVITLSTLAAIFGAAWFGRRNGTW